MLACLRVCEGGRSTVPVVKCPGTTSVTGMGVLEEKVIGELET